MPSTSRGSLDRRNKRRENQIKRNSGQSYVTKSKRIIEPRSMKRLEKCKRDCRSNISLENHCKIFSQYWNEASYKKRVEFVTASVTLHPKKRVRNKNKTKCRKFSVNYHLHTDSTDVVVCKKCFLSTLGESDSFVKNVVSKCWTEETKLPSSDHRGKHAPKNKTSAAKIQ